MMPWRGSLVLGFATGLTGSVAYADIPEEFERENWHVVEVLLFTQSWVSSADEPEQLGREAPTSLPSEIIVLPFSDDEREDRFSHRVDTNMEDTDDPWFFGKANDDYSIEDEARPTTGPHAAEAQEIKDDHLPDCEAHPDECSSFGSVISSRYPEWLPPQGVTPESTFSRSFDGIFLGDWAVSYLLHELQPAQPDEEDIEVEIDLTEEQLLQEQIATRFESFKQHLESTKFTRLEGDFEFGRAIPRLLDNQQRVLFHARWYQQLARGDAPTNVYLMGGRIFPNGMYEFEGTIGITVRNFLHFDAHVWNYTPDLPNSSVFRLPVVEIKETRRMRRNRTHFFDHPKFGLLIYTQRVELPEDLIALIDQSHN